MDNKHVNSGVVCQVTSCQYHTTQNCCSADKIEVCNCQNCNSGESDRETFCSTYRVK